MEISIIDQVDDLHEARLVVSRGREGVCGGVQGVQARPRLARPQRRDHAQRELYFFFLILYRRTDTCVPVYVRYIPVIQPWILSLFDLISLSFHQTGFVWCFFFASAADGASFKKLWPNDRGSERMMHPPPTPFRCAVPQGDRGRPGGQPGSELPRQFLAHDAAAASPEAGTRRESLVCKLQPSQEGGWVGGRKPKLSGRLIDRPCWLCTAAGMRFCFSVGSRRFGTLRVACFRAHSLVSLPAHRGGWMGMCIYVEYYSQCSGAPSLFWFGPTLLPRRQPSALLVKVKVGAGFWRAQRQRR